MQQMVNHLSNKGDVMRFLVHLFLSVSLILSYSTAPILASTRTIEIPKRAMPAKVRHAERKVKPFEPQFTLSANPTDSEISLVRLFPFGLVPMQTKAIDGENKALSTALTAYKKRAEQDDVSMLKKFLADFPHSRWRPSLEVNLGLKRYQAGYFSESLDNWKSAWNLSKDGKGSPQTNVANEALAQLIQIESCLGQKADLESSLKIALARHLKGANNDKVQRARKALSVMNHNPGVAYKCGPHALMSLIPGKVITQPANEILYKSKSSSKGTNLYELESLAHQVGLNYKMAKRSPGSEIIVPCVIHFKVGHFAAISALNQGRYRSQDPTFGQGGNIALSNNAIETESDGYFLIPEGKLPSGWSTVSQTEGETVWGKGYGNPAAPKGPCQDQQGMDSSCSSCAGGDSGDGGMARASTWSMQGTLHIGDTPLTYSPPVGRAIDFSITYDADEEEDMAGISTNLGTDARLNWVSFLELDSSSNATIVFGQGGSEYYPYPYTSNLYTNANLVNTAPGVYQRQLRDGSIEIFNQQDGAGRIFMTQVVDPIGNSVYLTYDTNFRLTTVTDAIGQASTLAYVSDTPGNLLFYNPAQITDPFGRSCSFTYDSTGLISITDQIGITSSFHHNSVTQQIDRMTTPYGTTGFYAFTPVLYRDSPLEAGATGMQFFYPDKTTSTLIAQAGYGSCTFFWDREAMMMYPSEMVPVDHAISGSHYKFTRWCFSGTGPQYSLTAVPYYVKPALENQTTYTYAGGGIEPGFPDFYIIGSSSNSATITRTVSGTTNQQWQYSYNSLGNATQSIDPVGRTFSFTYASNNIDLLSKSQTLSTIPDINGIWSGYSQHLPTSYEDGSGQFTAYTYNSFGELLTKTDAAGNVWTNSYDSNGYLTQINGPMPGSQDITTIAYDGYGRIYQVTNSEGYTITYSYDNGNRLLQTTYPDGTSEQISYLFLDPVLMTDRIGRCTQKAFDCMRHLSYQVDPLGRKTRYDWCACGALASLTDANGNKTQWLHDLEGRVTTKKLQDGTPTYFFYDLVGRLSSRQDSLNQITSYTYNVDNSLSQKSYSNVVNPTSTVSYTYDANYPRLTSVANGWGTNSYTYYPYITSPSSTTTGAGKIATATNNVISNSDISYSYDVIGRTTNRSINGSSNSTTWSYDQMSRVTNESNTLGSFGYNYVDDVSGNSRGVTRLSSVNYPNGQVTNYNWLGNLGDQRLQGIANLKSDGTCLSQFAYGYDSAGEITAWQQQQGPTSNQVFALTYDKAGQLIASKGDAFGTIGAPFSNQNLYTYDRGSNRTGEQKYLTTVANVGGTATAGDVVTITISDSGLAGGQEAVGYTVQSGDGIPQITNGLASAISADTNLQNIGVSSNSSDTQVYIYCASVNVTTFASSVNTGGSETISFGYNNNTLVNATVVGTPTVGDVLNIVVHDPSLTGGSQTVSYTVQSGDQNADIANGLSLAINANAALSALGVDGYYVEGSAQIFSDSPNVTTYTQSANTNATENVVFSLNTNPPFFGAIAGSASSGDVLTVIVYDAALTGGSESASYTVQSGDDLTAITSGLANAINADTNLSAIMDADTDGGTTLELYSFSLNPTRYRGTGSTGATETITISQNPDVGQTFANFGAVQSQYNNVNELVARSSGGVTQFNGTTNKAISSASVANNVVSIQQGAAASTTYSLPEYSSATEVIGLTYPLNGNVQGSLSGTVTTGDVLSLNIYNQALSTGQTQINYTVGSGDSLTSIAAGLSAAVNTNVGLQSLGITSSATSNSFSISQPGTTYSTSTSSGASEFFALGNNVNGNVSLTIQGPLTAGDVLTLTTSNAALTGGSNSVSYTVLASDTTTSIAANFAAAINASSQLKAIKITAANSSKATLESTLRFKGKTSLAAGENDTVLSAVDGGGNSASNNFQVFTPNTNSSTLTYDFNGNLTSDGTNSYLWDVENRLVQIIYPGSGNYTQFLYDSFQHCVKLSETRGGAITNIKQFVWTGTYLVESRDNVGTVNSQFFKKGQTIGNSKYYYTHDYSPGSVREMTDSSGALQTSYSYDPYGKTTSNLQGGVSSDFQFGGYYHHAASGLNLTLHRAYNSSLGKWLSRDPLGEKVGSNLYRYVLNDPISLKDSLGLTEYPSAFIGPIPPGDSRNPVPIFPPGESVEKNMQIAEDHPGDYFWFWTQVHNKGPWDYKYYCPGKDGYPSPYEPAGNFNFGAAAAAEGIPLEIALRGAGWANQVAAGSNADPAFGNWYGGPPYGDDPDDQYWIRQGYAYYGKQ
jgi:RHS repeat-associated protein